MPTRVTLHYYHQMINISRLWVSPLASESYLISIWALLEKASGLSAPLDWSMKAVRSWSSFLSVSKCSMKMCSCVLNLPSVWDMLFHVGPPLIVERSREQLLNKQLFFFFFFNCTCFICSRTCEWRLNCFDLLASALFDAIELHPFLSA